MAGYVKIIPFTVLRNTEKAGFFPRITGLVLLIAAIVMGYNQGKLKINEIQPESIETKKTIESLIEKFTNSKPSTQFDQQRIKKPSAQFDRQRIKKTSAQFDRQIIKDGSDVSLSIPELSGTHRNIPGDRELWIVAQSGSTCYPMDGKAVLMDTGVWKHNKISFPKKDNNPYFLSLVLVDSEASSTLKLSVGIQAGFPCDNCDMEIMEFISVNVGP